MFQVIECAWGRQEDVYHDVGIVECHPLAVLQSADVERLFMGRLSDGFLDGFGDGLYLTGGVSLANHEIITDGIFDIGEVGNDDAFSFFFLNTFGYVL